MKSHRILFAFALAASLSAAAIQAASAEDAPPRQKWSFAGPFGIYDQAQLQRGFKIYKEVCSTCHSIKLLGVTALAGSIIILAFMPWLDTSKVRSANYRPYYRQFLFIFFAAVIGLGYLGSQEPSGGYGIAARILTIYYFAFFLVILPLLGLFEPTKPLPNSISESVLSQGAAT